jgi:hypothetical protein
MSDMVDDMELESQPVPEAYEPYAEADVEEDVLPAEVQAALDKRVRELERHFNSVADRNTAKYQQRIAQLQAMVVAEKDRMELQQVAQLDPERQAKYWQLRAQTPGYNQPPDDTEEILNEERSRILSIVQKRTGRKLDELVVEAQPYMSRWSDFIEWAFENGATQAQVKKLQREHSEGDNSPRGLPAGYTSSGGAAVSKKLDKYRTESSWRRAFAQGEITSEEAMTLRTRNLPYK